jgi:hypothetical protein
VNAEARAEGGDEATVGNVGAGALLFSKNRPSGTQLSFCPSLWNLPSAEPMKTATKEF